MGDQPSYEEIAELFGLQAPELPDEDLEKLEGDDEDDVSDEERGEQKMAQGAFEEAIAHFRKAVEETGGASEEALIQLGDAYSASDMLPQAYRQYLKALKLHEENAESHLGLASVLKREGRLWESVSELERAIELESTNAYLRFQLAETLRSYSYRDRALTAILDAIRIAPDQAFYHYWAADLLIDLGRFEEAIDSIRAAVELSPGDSELYLKTAVAFWGAERHHDALKAARLASDLDPSNRIAPGLMAKMYDAQGLFEESELLGPQLKRMDAYDHEVVARLAKQARLPI